MVDLDSIEDGEIMTDEQLNEMPGEDKGESSLPEGFHSEKATFSVNVNDKAAKLKEKRARLKQRSDPLEDKEIAMMAVLNVEDIPPEKMGKTGNSSTGEISDEQKDVARYRTNGAKFFMSFRRMLKGR